MTAAAGQVVARCTLNQTDGEAVLDLLQRFRRLAGGGGALLLSR